MAATFEDCSAQNWWDLHSACSLPSWNPANPTSNSPTCEEDVSISTSFTNASNHSAVTADDSSRQFGESNELVGETASADNNLWSHLLLSIGNGGELQGEEKYSDCGMFQLPACDYLKKLDDPNNTNWELISSSSSPSFNQFDESNTNLTSESGGLVGNWSIAPPFPQPNQLDRNSDLFLCYNEPKTDTTRKPTLNNGFFQRQLPAFDASNVGMGCGYDGGSIKDNRLPCSGTSDPRNFCDLISFSSSTSSRLDRTGLWDAHVLPPAKPLCLKSLDVSSWKRSGLQASSTPTKNSGRGNIMINEGKKKRSDSSATLSKKQKQKQKHETSAASSVKMLAPKVKLGDKISALQQIVSPFGKTDTASVLLEAIGYIRFLQEQVQLLSNPYMKTASTSMLDPWGALDRKDFKREGKFDLKSRGLCVVPISCTTQIYRENGTGPDYWTPTYRGCLYR